MIRLEVRCCCQPQKLLGWLEADPAKALPGRLVRFAVKGRARLAPLWSGDGPGALCDVEGPRVIELPVEYIVPAGGTVADAYLALKSEETPLAVLRQVVGFIEARGASVETLP